MRNWIIEFSHEGLSSQRSYLVIRHPDGPIMLRKYLGSTATRGHSVYCKAAIIIADWYGQFGSPKPRVGGLRDSIDIVLL